MSKHLILACGLPGSSKTTLFNETFRDRNYFHLSADTIRSKILRSEQTGKYFDAAYENIVWDMYWKAFMNLMKTYADIYIDNTNISVYQRTKHIAIASQHGFKVSILYFNLDLEEVMKRNRSRENVGKRVNDRIMMDMYHKFEVPKEGEADELTYVYPRKK